MKINYYPYKGFDVEIDNPAYGPNWNMWVARYFELQLKSRVNLPDYVHAITLSSNVTIKISDPDGRTNVGKLNELCNEVCAAIVSIREELENMSAALEYVKK